LKNITAREFFYWLLFLLYPIMAAILDYHSAQFLLFKSSTRPSNGHTQFGFKQFGRIWHEELVSEQLLFSANSAIYKLYHGKNNEVRRFVLDQHA
jgi:hypothetical protein